MPQCSRKSCRCQSQTCGDFPQVSNRAGAGPPSARSAQKSRLQSAAPPNCRLKSGHRALQDEGQPALPSNRKWVITATPLPPSRSGGGSKGGGVLTSLAKAATNSDKMDAPPSIRVRLTKSSFSFKIWLSKVYRLSSPPFRFLPTSPPVCGMSQDDAMSPDLPMNNIANVDWRRIERRVFSGHDRLWGMMGCDGIDYRQPK